MLRAIHLAMLVTLLPSALAVGPADIICLEQLSPRVALAYWLGTDRRCNLTAIQTSRGLAIIDTEMSPRIMAPIKQRLEHHFGRSDWTYVINTHAHDSHAGGNSLFPGATIVGHENSREYMQWLIDRQRGPEAKRRTLEGVRQARRQGLTCDQTLQRLSVRSQFPEFRDPPPGHWAYGMQQRNVRNLWRILGAAPEPRPPPPDARLPVRPSSPGM